jgi:hypothetical protein
MITPLFVNDVTGTLRPASFDLREEKESMHVGQEDALEDSGE